MNGSEVLKTHNENRSAHNLSDELARQRIVQFTLERFRRHRYLVVFAKQLCLRTGAPCKASPLTVSISVMF